MARLTGLVLLVPVIVAGLLSSAPRAAQSAEIRVVYQPDPADFPNPERGFYYQDAPLWLEKERAPQSVADLRALRAEGVALVRWYFLIDEFRAAPLDAETLAYIEAQFAAAREAGIKVIPRFAYNFPLEGDYPYQEPDAPPAQVLAHLDQLQPLLRANSDVIAFMEAGFIGAWGEWHSSTNRLVDEEAGVNAGTRALVEKLLAVLPAERMVALRYARHKQQLVGTAPLTAATAFSALPAARLGAHNDCFLASQTDWGTYPEEAAEREAIRAYLNADNRFVPQGGETCNAAADAQPFIGCENAQRDLAWLRFSTLNNTYHPDVLAGWQEEGCYDDISRRLGYRFRLIEARLPATLAAGEMFTLGLTVVNEGFAAPYNPRAFFVILRAADGTVFTMPPTPPVDVRLWLPDAGQIAVTVTASLPADLPAGDYEVLLWLPDPLPSLAARPDYAIRLANRDVWEAATGYNRLRATIEITP